MMYEFELVYNSERFYTIFALLFGIILTSIIATYSLLRIRNRGHRIGAFILNVIVLIYQTSQFLAVISPPKELTLFASIQCIGFCLLGPAFYIYIRTLLKIKPIGLLEIIVLSCLSCVGIVLVLTNSIHGKFYYIYNTFYIRYEIMYIMTIIYNSLCAFAGCILLAKYPTRQEGYTIWQRILYPASLLIFIATGVFDGINPKLFSYDITPSSISIVQMLFFYSNRFSGLSGIFPIGRSNILDCINESVIMTDMKGSIIYYNNTPFNKQLKIENGIDILLLLTQQPNIYNNLNGLDTLYEHINLYKMHNNAHNHDVNDIIHSTSYGEFIIKATEKRFFSYSIQPIKKGASHIAGILYIFRDITEDINLLYRLDARNNELTAINERIKKYAGMVKQLSLEKERNSILKKISKDVEESILQIISLLEDIEPIDDVNAQEIKIGIQESIKVARNGITGIRKSVLSISTSMVQKGGKMND